MSPWTCGSFLLCGSKECQLHRWTHSCTSNATLISRILQCTPIHYSSKTHYLCFLADNKTRQQISRLFLYLWQLTYTDIEIFYITSLTICGAKITIHLKLLTLYFLTLIMTCFHNLFWYDLKTSLAFLEPFEKNCQCCQLHVWSCTWFCTAS